MRGRDPLEQLQPFPAAEFSCKFTLQLPRRAGRRARRRRDRTRHHRFRARVEWWPDHGPGLDHIWGGRAAYSIAIIRWHGDETATTGECYAVGRRYGPGQGRDQATI